MNPNDEKSREEFIRIQKAFEIIGDVEERKKYDSWKSSGIKIPYLTFRNLTKESQQSFHWQADKRSPQALMDISPIEQKKTQEDVLIMKFRNYEI